MGRKFSGLKEDRENRKEKFSPNPTRWRPIERGEGGEAGKGNGPGDMSLGFVSHSSALLVGEENFLRTQFFGKQRARNMSAMNANSL